MLGIRAQKKRQVRRLKNDAAMFNVSIVDMDD
jgi:hypothetical protein